MVWCGLCVVVTSRATHVSRPGAALQFEGSGGLKNWTGLSFILRSSRLTDWDGGFLRIFANIWLEPSSQSVISCLLIGSSSFSSIVTSTAILRLLQNTINSSFTSSDNVLGLADEIFANTRLVSKFLAGLDGLAARSLDCLAGPGWYTSYSATAPLNLAQPYGTVHGTDCVAWLFPLPV